MANWCSLYTTIKLKNEKQASELLDRIEKTITKNNFDFGGEHYIFGIDSYLYEDEIHISGDARWEFPQEDMCKLVKWLKQTVPVRDMYVEMDYEERGCQIYGKYILEDGILSDCYLSEDEIPDYPEINEDDDEEIIDSMYIEEIQNRIEKTEPELVYDYNIEE